MRQTVATAALEESMQQPSVWKCVEARQSFLEGLRIDRGLNGPAPARQDAVITQDSEQFAGRR